jgi:hypothetical protein
MCDVILVPTVRIGSPRPFFIEPLPVPALPKVDQQLICQRIAAHILTLPLDYSEDAGIFAGTKYPPITMMKYVERLVKYTNKYNFEKDGLDSTGMISALVAVELLERAQIKVNAFTMHRYFATAMLLATKVVNDWALWNKDWAGITGIPKVQEMNKMEAELLKRLNWDVNVSEEVFRQQFQRFTY